MDAALEWQAWKNSLCSGCGHPKHETFLPDEHPDAVEYDAEALRCAACAARDRKAREIGKAPGADTAGLYISVTEVTDE